MDTFGTGHFVLYREVVLSSEVEIEEGGTSVCVLHRKAFSTVSFIGGLL